MSKKILEIKDLYVEYVTDEAQVYAINGLNLTVCQGETLGLVGETGAGKTSTALSVMQLLPEKTGFIKNGSIHFGDVEITKLKEEDMRLIRGDNISMIFQDPMTSLNPIMTIGDQIGEIIMLHRRDISKQEISRKVDDILQMVGLPKERKFEYPHQFSGGMKQRVIIAIALACEPQLLIADEPTTALDVTIQAQVLEMMEDLKKRFHTAMLLITHDLGVVAQICDKVAIMYAGEIIEYGTVEHIFQADNHHPYSTGLFGSIPDMTKVKKRLSPIAGLMPDPTKKLVGCKFHDRCPLCYEPCKKIQPTEFQKDGHMIKCHKLESLWGGI